MDAVFQIVAPAGVWMKPMDRAVWGMVQIIISIKWNIVGALKLFSLNFVYNLWDDQDFVIYKVKYDRSL